MKKINLMLSVICHVSLLRVLLSFLYVVIFLLRRRDMNFFILYLLDYPYIYFQSVAPPSHEFSPFSYWIRMKITK